MTTATLLSELLGSICAVIRYMGTAVILLIRPYQRIKTIQHNHIEKTV